MRQCQTLFGGVEAKLNSQCRMDRVKTRVKLYPAGSDLWKGPDADSSVPAVFMIARTYQHVSVGVWLVTGLFASG